MTSVSLFDIDSLSAVAHAGKIPNLALMKISAHYKKQGMTVILNGARGDLNYVSCIFFRNRQKAMRISEIFSAALGGPGSGRDAPLPDHIEHICPDYALYLHIDYSLGFTSRGCIRRCAFCAVWKIEGDIREHSPLDEFVRYRKVVLLDNNFLASPLWKDKLLEMIDRKLTVDFNQGLDIRLMDEEKAHLLTFLDPPYLRFAFDHPEEEAFVRKGIDMLRNAGYPIDRHRLGFYVLVGFNTTLGEDVYRCQMLHSLGVNTHVQVYGGAPRVLRHLARWANRPWIWMTTKWEDYRPQKIEKLRRALFQ